jgi:adenylate cyclase
MAQEIERKFLVRSDAYKNLASKHTRITQGYLSSVPERTVRIRIRDNTGYITIKGLGNDSGASRYEWEKEIPLTEARALLRLCEPGVIDKTRYEIQSGLHTFEVDEFYGDNLGLVVAEVELSSEAESFEKPEWMGHEVTGDVKYYNAMLMKNPYRQWHHLRPGPGL